MNEIFCGSIEISNRNVTKLSENTSDIKLFKIKLSTYYHLVPRLVEFLNVNELQRAEKYHFEKDANQFIICRVLLKYILSQYTNIDIAAVQIEKDENKKPYLLNHGSVYFNVSHAENYAIIALSNNAVGIDLEYLNKNFDFSEVLPYTLSKLEVKTVLKANNKTYAFYKFWTRKEAIVKATGKGISDHLRQIPVMDGSHIVTPNLMDDFKNLQVLSFDMDKNYIASIALSDVNLSFNKLIIYNIPSSLEGLLSFCSEKKMI